MVQINRKTPKSYLNKPVGVVNVSTGAYEANMSIARSLEGISNNLFRVAQQEIREDRIQEGKEFARNAVVYQDGQFKDVDTSSLRGSAKKVADDILREKYLASARLDLQGHIDNLDFRFNNQEEGYKTAEDLRDNMSVYIGETSKKIEEFDPTLASEFRQLGETYAAPAYAGFQVKAAELELKKSQAVFQNNFDKDISIHSLYGKQGNLEGLKHSIDATRQAALAAKYTGEDISKNDQEMLRRYFYGATARLAGLPQDVAATVVRDFKAGVFTDVTKQYFPDIVEIYPNLSTENVDKLGVEFGKVFSADNALRQALSSTNTKVLTTDPSSKNAGKVTQIQLEKNNLANAWRNPQNLEDPNIAYQFANLKSVPSELRAYAKQILGGHVDDVNSIQGAIGAINLITKVDSTRGNYFNTEMGISDSDLFALRSMARAIEADPQNAANVVQNIKAIKQNRQEYNRQLEARLGIDITPGSNPLVQVRDYLHEQKGYSFEYADANAYRFLEGVVYGNLSEAEDLLEYDYDREYTKSDFLYNPMGIDQRFAPETEFTPLETRIFETLLGESVTVFDEDKFYKMIPDWSYKGGIIGSFVTGEMPAAGIPFSPARLATSFENKPTLQKRISSSGEMSNINLTGDQKLIFGENAFLQPTAGSVKGNVRWAVVNSDGQYVQDSNGENIFIHSKAIKALANIERKRRLPEQKTAASLAAREGDFGAAPLGLVPSKLPYIDFAND